MAFFARELTGVQSGLLISVRRIEGWHSFGARVTSANNYLWTGPESLGAVENRGIDRAARLQFEFQTHNPQNTISCNHGPPPTCGSRLISHADFRGLEADSKPASFTSYNIYNETANVRKWRCHVLRCGLASNRTRAKVVDATRLYGAITTQGVVDCCQWIVVVVACLVCTTGTDGWRPSQRSMVVGSNPQLAKVGTRPRACALVCRCRLQSRRPSLVAFGIGQPGC